MKKNVMMRVASVLLICVLLTSSVISGTFAKYVTTASGSDSARVAKWGVTVNAGFGSLFNQTYDTDAAWAGDDGVSVKADADVVAPGTTGTLADFNVNGAPEVDVEVTYTADLVLTGWFLDVNKDGVQDTGEDEYCPLVFNVNGELFYIGKSGISTVAALEAAVEAAIIAKTEKYNVGADLHNELEADLDVSWTWNYETHPWAPYQTDAKDTTMGDAAAADEAATIELTVSCTVTQID